MKHNFKVIKGGQTTKIEKRNKKRKLYKKIFEKAKNDVDVPKIVYWGIVYYHYLNIDSLSYEETKEAFYEIFRLEQLVGYLSFYSIFKLFPIDKDFDGHKYECKDYFSTMDYLKDKEFEKMICEYDVDDFFWNYYNSHIMGFQIKKMLIYDKLARFTGSETLMEGFSRMFDVPIYTKFDENAYVSSKGDVLKVSKPKKKIPKGFKIIK